MIKRYNNTGLLWGGLGIILRIVTYVMMFRGSCSDEELGFAALLSGVFLLIGFYYFTKAKGRSRWWSLLVFTPLYIAAPILLCLRDDSEDEIIYRPSIVTGSIDCQKI